MKTIALLAVSLLLPACTADVFAAGDDAGPVPTVDGGSDTDATPDTDADPAADGGSDTSPTQDADATAPLDASDAAVKADSGTTDSGTDSGPEPMCAPLGFKNCANDAGFSKCEVKASDGTATCVVPGSTPHQSGCVKDGDCGSNEVCDSSLCRSLCEKTYQTPWGTNQTIWAAKGCAGCPFGQSYQLPRLPSWLGVCIN